MDVEIFREALMSTSLAGVIVLGAASFALFAWPLLREAWERLGGWSEKTAVVLSCSLACLFGGSKSGTISYPRTDPDVWYLQDNGSAVSNDFVRIGFTRNIIVPDTASFFIDGLELKYTNQSDWATHSFNAYSNTFDRMSVPFDLQFATATNFNWIAYTDWTPQPVVHTNGVAFVVWQIGVGKQTNDLAMTRTGVYSNGVKVAPNPAITNGPPVINAVIMETNQ